MTRVCAIVLATMSLCCIAKADTYTVTELGGYATFAYRMNNLGQVAGQHALDGPGPAWERAFLWDASSGMRDIGMLSGSWSDAYAVNNLGQVVGRSDGVDVQPFIWEPNGDMRDLGSLGGHSGAALGVNDMGEVVGWSESADGQHAFTWDSALGMQDIGAGIAYSVNNAGQVVGRTRWQRAFLWDRIDGVRDLGTLGGTYSEANDINDLGQIVGDSSTATGEYHPFIWDSVNGMRDLGTPSSNAPAASRAFGFNNMGDVVGCSPAATGQMHAFIWDATNGMRDLGELADLDTAVENQHISGAVDINDNGQTLVHYSGGQVRFLTPVPEPSSLLTLLSMMGAAVCTNRLGNRVPR